MSTRDPFLISISVLIDRCAVFLVTLFIFFALSWELLLVKYLGLSATAAAEIGYRVLMLKGAPVENALFLMNTFIVAQAATFTARWMFGRWQRAAEVPEAHLRGTKTDGF